MGPGGEDQGKLISSLDKKVGETRESASRFVTGESRCTVWVPSRTGVFFGHVTARGAYPRPNLGKKPTKLAFI